VKKCGFSEGEKRKVGFVRAPDLGAGLSERPLPALRVACCILDAQDTTVRKGLAAVPRGISTELPHW